MASGGGTLNVDTTVTHSVTGGKIAFSRGSSRIGCKLTVTFGLLVFRVSGAGGGDTTSSSKSSSDPNVPS